MRVWKEVFAELGKDFDVKDLRDLTEEIEKAKKAKKAKKAPQVFQSEEEEIPSKRSQPYAPIWVYRKRLDKVLGLGGYRVNVTNPCVQHAQKLNIDILTVQVSLQLLEDDFRTVAFEVQKPGLAEITNAGSLQMNLGKATSAGLKDCCDEFKIGGNIEWIWRNAHSTVPAGQKNAYWQNQQPVRQTSTSVAQEQQQRPVATEEIFKVSPAGALSEGKNGTYYIPVRTSNGKEVELWFYKDRCEPLLSQASKCPSMGCKNRLDDILKVWAVSKGVLSLKGQINEERGKLYFHQLVDSKK